MSSQKRDRVGTHTHTHGGQTSSLASHRHVLGRTAGQLKRPEEMELQRRTAVPAEFSKQEREEFGGELVVTSTFSETRRIKRTENVD